MRRIILKEMVETTLMKGAIILYVARELKYEALHSGRLEV